MSPISFWVLDMRVEFYSPGKVKDWTAYMKAYRLLTGHELAYKSIKSFDSNYRSRFLSKYVFLQSLQEVEFEVFAQHKTSHEDLDNPHGFVEETSDF